MSEERETEQAGAPVEQAEATETQLLAAVERAAEAGEAPQTSAEGAAEAGAEAQTAEPSAKPEDRPVIAPVVEPPSAGAVETPAQIFEAQTTAVEPQPPIERDGEIRINADHPMAALYMQSPMPPDMKGNRGAGVLISLLATAAFALVYAGVLALWLAPNYPPSRFLNEGLLPWVLNWGFAAAVVGFFAGMAILVLIVGRAGWWAYVLGGFLVAALVWALSVLVFGLVAEVEGGAFGWRPLAWLQEFGLFFPVIIAAIVAREVTVWFGAWIGARGRKVSRQNAAALTEYEDALAEVRAK